MSLERLLGEMTPEDFVANHLHRLPYSTAGKGNWLRECGSWDTLGTILAAGHEPDLLVVRQGERYAGNPPASLPEARQLSEQGYTILVRHVERHDPRIRELADSFARSFLAPVDVHLYVTPAGSHGFSWHYDAEDVFIIQTAGRKEYSLRKNTVHPWPLVDTIPRNMRYERELMPMMKAELWAGDWLYIPCGYWHKAEARESDEAAISLAVGVMSRSAIGLLDFLRSRLLDSLLWRQRLPTLGSASPLDKQSTTVRYREIASMLADDVAAALRDDAFLDAYVDWVRKQAPALPAEPMGQPAVS